GLAFLASLTPIAGWVPDGAVTGGRQGDARSPRELLTPGGLRLPQDLASAAMIARQNAGRSSGLREVMRLPSTTTSASVQLAPAALGAPCREKNDVPLRPFSPPAETSIQPAWQMAATTFPCCAASRTRTTMAS